MAPECGEKIHRSQSPKAKRQELGPNCTTRAIEERLKKLKKRANGLMDETAPHVLGSTRKMEAEFRAKREAETAAVQRRRPKTKAKTLPPSPKDDSETASKKTGLKPICSCLELSAKAAFHPSWTSPTSTTPREARYSP